MIKPLWMGDFASALLVAWGALLVCQGLFYFVANVKGRCWLRLSMRMHQSAMAVLAAVAVVYFLAAVGLWGWGWGWWWRWWPV